MQLATVRVKILLFDCLLVFTVTRFHCTQNNSCAFKVLILFCCLQTTFQFQEWDSRRPHNTNPSLDFLAPEYILTKSCSEKSDIFSFGMLCYGVYNGGRALCSSLNNLLSFKQNVETVRVCVCVCVCVRERERVCVCVCVHACV